MSEIAPSTILIPVTSDADAISLANFAAALCSTRGGIVTAVAVVPVSEGRSFAEGAEAARQRRQSLYRALEDVRRHHPETEIEVAVRIAQEVWQGIEELVAEQEADLVLFGWKAKEHLGQRLFGRTMAKILASPPADVGVVRLTPPADPALAGAPAGAPVRILLPARGGPAADLALDLVHSLRERWGSEMTLLRVERPGAALVDRMVERDRFDDLCRRAQASGPIRRLNIFSDQVEEAIGREATHHDLVVLGAAVEPEPGTLLGRLPEAILSTLPCSVMVVKGREPVDPALFARPSDVAGEMVDKWFGENTFHGREFSRIDELVDLKRQRGLTISVGLPALNEEATVGNVIRILKEALIERHPLIDELVLIDGGSSDRTREIAASHGIPVYVQGDILPQYGDYQGKGEGLWKSLYALHGDIVAWMDTDIKNVHPKFIYGVIGPLLRERRLRYVVGYYRRTIRIGGSYYETGGDAVNELSARPLVNMFYPQLSGLIQPASREVASYREVLENIPFFTGYGVEMGHLIDILDYYGLSAIGQSDLEERIHRESSLISLGERAYALQKVVMRRIERDHSVRLLDELNTSMKLIQQREGRFVIKLQQVGDVERPPMLSIPEYRELRAQRRATP